jgi:hypothetical protein
VIRFKALISLVRAGRLELPRPLGQQILSLPRLPFRHARLGTATIRAPSDRSTGADAIQQPSAQMGLECLTVFQFVEGRPTPISKPSNYRVFLRK